MLRKESETIYYQGKYFASLDYLAESLGLPFEKDVEHNEWLKLGYSISEEAIKENFISIFYEPTDKIFRAVTKGGGYEWKNPTAISL